MIPHEYIEELTRRTDIVELVGSYVQLKRKGRLYGGLCPFHSEKSPSFYVYPDTQSFYCFGCGAGGDAIVFACCAARMRAAPPFCRWIPSSPGWSGAAFPARQGLRPVW